ncbi:hypothetical protein [Lentzea sp. E54]|uniref:hypothetical protein n=1 Tax=Lentzea xerophila TaxID=3435883 RepID=UPI003DA3891E
MIEKALFAAVGGALLAVAAFSSADGIQVADHLCAAPWQWNGPLSLLHESYVPGYAVCDGDRAGGGSDISVLDAACAAPWQWNGPLEIYTADHSASCDHSVE